MIYIVDEIKYEFSYSELQNLHEKFKNMSDDEFMQNLPAILHFACYAAWIKELPRNTTLSDKGIIHRLVHLLHIPKEEDLDKTRTLFNDMLAFV